MVHEGATKRKIYRSRYVRTRDLVRPAADDREQIEAGATMRTVSGFDFPIAQQTVEARVSERIYDREVLWTTLVRKLSKTFHRKARGIRPDASRDTRNRRRTLGSGW